MTSSGSTPCRGGRCIHQRCLSLAVCDCRGLLSMGHLLRLLQELTCAFIELSLRQRVFSQRAWFPGLGTFSLTLPLSTIRKRTVLSPGPVLLFEPLAGPQQTLLRCVAALRLRLQSACLAARRLIMTCCCEAGRRWAERFRVRASAPAN